MPDAIELALAETARLNDWLRELERTEQPIQHMGRYFADRLSHGGRILSCGNGGSMCDAMHFAEELSGRYRRDRAALPAQAISDPAHISCVANDWGYDRIFARGVEAWGRPGDTLIVFSTSGNSRNLIAAAETASASGLGVVGLLGRDGGALRPLCDRSIVVPGTTADRIQEVHIKVVHLVIEVIERLMFPANYA